MRARIRVVLAGALFVPVAAVAVGPSSAAAGSAHARGKFPVIYMATRSGRARTAASLHSAKPAAPSSKLAYAGGPVQVRAKIALVVWGSQWNTAQGNPDNEDAYVAQFFHGLYGPKDTWSTNVTQYCQGAGFAMTSCATPSGKPIQKIVHPSASPLLPVFFDNTAPAPAHPNDADLAKEVTKAAAHFGNKTNASNADVQYWILTSSGNNSLGFGIKDGYCAYHTAIGSKFGDLAYVNFPYIPDAGVHCGAGDVNPGRLDGVTIVAGHEYTETVTDPLPVSGWTDDNFDENGDKCIFITPGSPGGEANLALSTGTFAVQSLWSNNFGANGGCVISYVSKANQHQ